MMCPTHVNKLVSLLLIFSLFQLKTKDKVLPPLHNKSVLQFPSCYISFYLILIIFSAHCQDGEAEAQERC